MSALAKIRLTSAVFVLLFLAFGLGACSALDSDDCSPDNTNGIYPKKCLGPEPDPRLMNAEWTMTQALDGQGQPIESVMQLIAQGRELKFGMTHGLGGISGVNDIALCGYVNVPLLYSPTALTYDPSRTYPAPSVACPPDPTGVLVLLFPFFQPRVDRILDESTPKELTLTNPDGTAFRFVDTTPG